MKPLSFTVMTRFMGRGRTHAVGSYSLNDDQTTTELKKNLQEEIAQKMNLGMDDDDLRAVEDRIDTRQITAPSDISIACHEEHPELDSDRVECIVAVDEVNFY